MRIWAFPSFYPYNYPGLTSVGTFAHRQYKGLIENGATVNVIVPVLWHPPFPFCQLVDTWKQYHKYNYPKHRVYDGINVYHPTIANMRPNRFVKKTYQQRFADAIINFFKDNNITLNSDTDVFYSQWLPNAVLVQQVAHQLGIKSAILGIGDDVIIEPQRSEVRFAQFKKVLQEADMCLYCADYLGREANKLTQLNLPYQVAYFGIDYAKFAPCTKETTLQLKKEYNIPLDKVVILNVASPIIRKGWIDLFDALVEIKKTTNNFVLAGAYAGPKDFEILEEVEKRGLTNNFVNIGEIKPENLSKLYNAADIYCMPSHWEGLATVIMESMSSGLAVITTDMCGHPEIVTNGVTGVLIPVKRVDILTTELLELINNKEKRALLGNNARNFIVNKWGNPKENALKLLEKLQTLLTK